MNSGEMLDALTIAADGVRTDRTTPPRIPASREGDQQAAVVTC